MNAQNLFLIGLPEHSVELGGSLEFPHVINRSAKHIIAYVLLVEDSAGGYVDMTMANPTYVPLLRGLPIAAGGNSGDGGASEAWQRAAQRMRKEGTPVTIQKVTLDSVLFADGEFVGPNTADLFKLISRGFGMGKEVALKNLLDPKRLGGQK